MPNIIFVDQNDNIIGAGTGKEAREKGIIHRISRVFLFNSKGELLIQKRADNIPTLPGRWDQSAAGHVDEGEDYLTAAKRELEEEVGVKNIELAEKGKFFTDEKDQPGKIIKRFNALYAGTYDGEVQPNPEEVSETRWIDPKELSGWMDEQSDDFTEGFIKNFRNLQIVNLHQKYAPSPKIFDSVFSHCQIICEIAEELIRKGNIQCNIELVKSGALIHDIGVYKVTDKDGVDGNYIQHGIKGEKILRDEGFPETLCRIAERHTGVGITKEQVLANSLPLPSKDYIAETIEEKLVMYADKFHSKNPDHFNSFESYRKFVSRFGEESVKKFDDLAVLFGKPDLESLSKKYNQPIL